MDRKTLVRRLDKLTSVLVRLHSDRCCTCNKKLDFKHRQCGHYVPRVVQTTRWDLRNCNVQCATCNVEKGGNLKKYAEFMKTEYGLPNKIMYDTIYEVYKMGKLKSLPTETLESLYHERVEAVHKLEQYAEQYIPKEW